MTKKQEIELLEKMISTALRDNAGYLQDTLSALLPHFTAAVQSDFPGEMAVENVRCERDDVQLQLRQATEELADKRKALADIEGKINSGRSDLARINRFKSEAGEKLRAAMQYI